MSRCQTLLLLASNLTFFFAFPAGVKERNSVPQLTDFDIPTSFWYELKSLTEALMDNVNCELSLSDVCMQTSLIAKRSTPSCPERNTSQIYVAQGQVRQLMTKSLGES